MGCRGCLELAGRARRVQRLRGAYEPGDAVPRAALSWLRYSCSLGLSKLLWSL